MKPPTVLSMAALRSGLLVAGWLVVGSLASLPAAPQATPQTTAAPEPSRLVIPSDWRQTYPFSERFALSVPLPARTGSAARTLDLAAIRFRTDGLARTDPDGTRIFDLPDVRSFHPSLIRDPFTTGTQDLFLVQATSPQNQAALRRELDRRRIPVRESVAQFTFVVELTRSQYQRLGRLTDVAWIGLYQPAWRIAPMLDYVIEAEPLRSVSMTALFDLGAYSSAAALEQHVSAAGLTVLDVTRRRRDWKVRVAGRASQARDLLASSDCLWVERYAEPQLHNNISRSSAAITTGRGATAGPILDVEDVWARGIRGEGQIAAASDTGLSTGNLSTLHWDFGQQGSGTNPMRVIATYTIGRPGIWDDNQTTGGGHGTHTSGSIVGNGVRSGADPSTNSFPASSYAGTAPKAQFVFQSIMNSGGGLSLPGDLNNLFQPPYNDGARVHSNSWGASVNSYTADAQEVDEFIWNNPDFVITYSAGNDGVDGGDGVIDAGSLGSPGTAKNNITVGASENYRPSFVYEFPAGDCTSSNGIEQRTWGWFSAGSFPVSPIFPDLMADDASGLGAFSSRGPTTDNRFKPELVAPGIAIVSTRTDLNQAYEQWGICDIPVPLRPYYITLGGTSMSNPLTAGAATLVRQYYDDGWHANGSSITNPLPQPVDAFNPSAALVKATLINGAWDMDPGQYGTGPTQEIPPGWDGASLPNNAEGYGRVDLEASLFPNAGYGRDPNRQMKAHDVAAGLQTGQFTDYAFTVNSSADPLVATLVWTDPYASTGAGTKLVNDLDLTLISPTATTYYPNAVDDTTGPRDAVNNTEQAKVTAPAAGAWTARVAAFNVPGNIEPGSNVQPYALVISAVLDLPCSTPPIPTGLGASVTVPDQVDLVWSAVAADSYSVYRATTPGGPYSLIASGVVTAAYSDTTVSAGTTYYYVVTAVNNPGCQSAQSNEASAVPFGDCVIPPTFSGLTSLAALPAGQGCGLRLEWSAGSSSCDGSLVYNVWRGTGSAPDPDVDTPYATCVTNTFFDDTAMNPSTDYHYVVRAEDATLGHGGQCNGGNYDLNTTTLNGSHDTLARTVLYENDFESCAGLCDLWRGSFGAGGTNNWRGVQECPAGGGNDSYRFGATTCAGSHNNNRHDLVFPDPLAGAQGVTVPAGTSNTLATFRHRWDFESGFDGGFLWMSLDTTFATFNYIPITHLSGQLYNDTAFGLAGFGGTSPGFASGTLQQTTVDLDAMCDQITGGTSGCAGRRVYLGFNGRTDVTINNTGWFVDDVTISVAGGGGGCPTAPASLQLLTATAISTQNEIEWLTPASCNGTTDVVIVRRDTASFPIGPADGTAVGVPQTCSFSAHGSVTDTPLTNDTTYYYSAFVDNGAGNASGRRTVTARPFDTSGNVKWAYSTAASAVAPPTIGSVYGVSNDRIVHSMERTVPADLGTWPIGWTPHAMNAPSQTRLPILPIALSGATKVAFVSSLDGRVAALDADTGAELWSTPPLSDTVSAGVAGMFTAFGGSQDLLMLGTRSAVLNNAFVGLSLAGGTAWTFDNSGNGAIGIISSAASVVYADNRVYFASRRHPTGSTHTVWCLTVGPASASLLWSADIGDVDGSPILHDNALYVGTNDGRVYALDPATGAALWSSPFDAADGPVKGYVYPRFGTNELVFSTTNTVWAIADNGGSASLVWSVTSIPSPSIPLVSVLAPYAWVGGGDGNLHQLEISGAAPVLKTVPLGDASAAGGSPALDLSDNMLYIGTDAGRMYAISVPLP